MIAAASGGLTLTERGQALATEVVRGHRLWESYLDRHFELAKLEPTTRSTYLGYANKHVRPLIGAVKVGTLDADVFDSFYAELRRCREHCDRRPSTQHRTTVEHECDARCRPHECTSLGESTIWLKRTTVTSSSMVTARP